MVHGMKNYTSLGLVLLAAMASASPIMPSMSNESLSPNVTTQALSRMVSTPLVQKDVNQFLGCVSTTKVPYNVGVDGMGYIVVVPSNNRTMDLNGQDEGLLDCMTQAVEVLKTAAAGSSPSGGFPLNGTYKSLTNVDYNWLRSKGAEGHKREGTTTPRKTGAGLEARANDLYFNYYGSEAGGCNSEELIHSNLNVCNNYMQLFKSQQLENVSLTKTLRVTLWPHHRCEKGNSATYVVAPHSTTRCINRSTYSYYGVYR